MLALDNMVPDELECAKVQNKLSNYMDEHRVFANMHATKDRDKLNPTKLWNTYDSCCINW